MIIVQPSSSGRSPLSRGFGSFSGFGLRSTSGLFISRAILTSLSDPLTNTHHSPSEFDQRCSSGIDNTSFGTPHPKKPLVFASGSSTNSIFRFASLDPLPVT
jgi:hypothetical protein